jgi:hypothetical protein
MGILYAFYRWCPAGEENYVLGGGIDPTYIPVIRQIIDNITLQR